jgi:hypothetical protein
MEETLSMFVDTVEQGLWAMGIELDELDEREGGAVMGGLSIAYRNGESAEAVVERLALLEEGVAA